MYKVQIHKVINSIFSSFFRLGLWHPGDEATIRETRIKLFYSIYNLLLPISLMAGSLSSDNRDESIFLIEGAIMATVFSVKLMYIILRKKKILELLNRVGVYSLENLEECTIVNDTLKNLMRFVRVFISLSYTAMTCSQLVIPFLGGEKKLFFNVGLPLDWKNNEIAFWIAFVFLVTEIFLTAVAILFSILMWYLMTNCAIRYEVLGHQIKNMGVIREVVATANRRKITVVEKQNLFLQDLISHAESHKDIMEY